MSRLRQRLVAHLRRARDRGVVAVEFALVLPLLLLLVLGGIDWGYYFFAGQVVANAAREGARAGSIARDRTNACTGAGAAIDSARAYLMRARLIASTADTRLKPFDCTDGNGCCTQTVNCPGCPIDPIPSAIEVRVVYQARPSRNSMSLTGYLPAALLPRWAFATSVMRMEP